MKKQKPGGASCVRLAASLLTLLGAQAAHAIYLNTQDAIAWTSNSRAYVGVFAEGTNGHLKYKVMDVTSGVQYSWSDLGKPAGGIGPVKAISYVDISGQRQTYVFTLSAANGSDALAMCHFSGRGCTWSTSYASPGQKMDHFTAITYPTANGHQAIDVFVTSMTTVTRYSCTDCNGSNGTWTYMPAPAGGTVLNYGTLGAVTYLDNNSRRRIHVFVVVDWYADWLNHPVAQDVSSLNYDGMGNWTWMEHPNHLSGSGVYSAATPAPITYVDFWGQRRIDVFLPPFKFTWSGSAAYEGAWFHHSSPTTYPQSADTFTAAYAASPISYADSTGHTHVYSFQEDYTSQGWFKLPRNVVVNYTNTTDTRDFDMESTWYWANMSQMAGAPDSWEPTAVTVLEPVSGKQLIYVFSVNVNDDHMTMIYWNGAAWNWADLGNGV